jgi:hypothetical protein
MHKALQNLPVFDPEGFRTQTAGWKEIVRAAGPGGGRIVVEWGVGRGPNVFVYPATKRAAGIHLVSAASNGQSDERWADFLEFEYLPKVVDALKTDGHNPQVNCVDLRPLQVQRARRRTIEANAREKTGAAATH